MQTVLNQPILVSATKRKLPMLSLLARFFQKPRQLGLPLANLSGKIIAAKVVKIDKHPNADRLRVVQLYDGHQTTGPVVCGASNFQVGDIVVLALPGARIAQNIHSRGHDSFVLQTATIRGVKSQGMICAAFELGLSKRVGDGVMVLPATTAVGTILG